MQLHAACDKCNIALSSPPPPIIIVIPKGLPCIQRHHVDVACGDDGGDNDVDDCLHHQEAAAAAGRHNRLLSFESNLC